MTIKYVWISQKVPIKWWFQRRSQKNFNVISIISSLRDCPRLIVSSPEYAARDKNNLAIKFFCLIFTHSKQHSYVDKTNIWNEECLNSLFQTNCFIVSKQITIFCWLYNCLQCCYAKSINFNFFKFWLIFEKYVRFAFVYCFIFSSLPNRYR